MSARVLVAYYSATQSVHLEDPPWADGYAFGRPARYGAPAANDT